jgi:hypothetical protein
MGPLPLLIGALAVVAIAGQSQPVACSEIDLVLGASRPAVRGVVERELVAANPMPWGSSVAVVTRVWGSVVVERWGTIDEVGECRMPSEHPVYEGVGIEEVLVPAEGVLGDLELAVLNSQFGPPTVYAPSAFARAMAWLRVFPSVPIVVLVVGWLVVTLVRRRHRADPYLF